MKKTVCVIFGGASSEYEVSLMSSASILRNLDAVAANGRRIDRRGEHRVDEAVEEDAEVSEEVEEVTPENYVFEDKSSNNTMASLFANIKLN